MSSASWNLPLHPRPRPKAKELEADFGEHNDRIHNWQLSVRFAGLLMAGRHPHLLVVAHMRSRSSWHGILDPPVENFTRTGFKSRKEWEITKKCCAITAAA